MINRTLQIFFIVAVVILIGIILRYLAKKKLNLKYTLLWLLAAIAMLVFAIFPQLVDAIGGLVGIASTVSTVFVFAGMFLFLIVLTLTAIVSHQNTRIYRLTQTQALLEKRIRELEAAQNGSEAASELCTVTQNE